MVDAVATVAEIAIAVVVLVAIVEGAAPAAVVVDITAVAAGADVGKAVVSGQSCIHEGWPESEGNEPLTTDY